MPLEELIMCFLLANASLNKISVLVTGACQSLVHFSFTHPFYVRTVYKRARVWALCSAPQLALTPSECQRPGLGPGHSHHHDRSRDTRWSPRCPHGADPDTLIPAPRSWWHTMQTLIKLFNCIIPSILVKNDNEVVFPENPWTLFFLSSPLRRQKHNSE